MASAGGLENTKRASGDDTGQPPVPEGPRSGIDRSEHTTQVTADPPSDSQSAGFLLAEFSERSQDWRHTDSLVEHALGLYLTICTILVTGTAVFSQLAKKPEPILTWAISFVAIALAVAGIGLARRVLGADITKTELSRAQRLIRAYFANRDTEVAAYLSRPVEGSPTGLSRDQIVMSLRPRAHLELVWSIRAWISLLTGVGVARPLKRVACVLPDPAVVAIGVAVSIICCFGLGLLFRFWTNRIRKVITTE